MTDESALKLLAKDAWITAWLKGHAVETPNATTIKTAESRFESWWEQHEDLKAGIMKQYDGGIEPVDGDDVLTGERRWLDAPLIAHDPLATEKTADEIAEERS